MSKTLQVYKSLKESFEALKKELKQVEDNLLEEYQEEIEKIKSQKQEPFGTINLDDFSVNIAKKVTWNQEKLEEIYNEINSSGSNGDDFIDKKISYSVDERKYKDWNSEIKNYFIDARSVSEGATSIKLKEKE